MNVNPKTEQLHFCTKSLPERSGYSDTADIALVLNQQMDRLLVPQGVNEEIVNELLLQLEQYGDPNAAEFWLTLARLAEMALLCAGHYADNGNFDGAGDLLFNPKQVHIYQKGYQKPIVKPRRASVSDTLGLADVPADVRCRQLLFDTLVRVERGPLLPEMSAKMIQSQRFSQHFIDRFQRRMKQVASTIAFVSAWNLPASVDLHKALHSTSEETRRFVLSHLCRFQGTVFFRLGNEIDRLRKNPQHRSSFLVPRYRILGQPIG